MPSFKNVKELNKFLKDKVIRDILTNEMARMVRKVEQEKIQEVVYDAYPHPKMYSRRGHVGGLISDDNMVATVSNNGVVLEVENVTPANEEYETLRVDYLPALIEFGHGSAYKGRRQFYTYYTIININAYDDDSQAFAKPRPFTKATRDKIEEEGLHIKTMKEALRYRGIQTK